MGGAAEAIPALRRAVAPGAEAKALARLAKDPQLVREMEGFAKAAAKAPDVKAALRDPRVLNVLLPALGLPDAVGQPGLALRALTADPKSRDGLLARLPDSRWKAAAATLNLRERGVAALRDPKVQASVADGLRRIAWRGELDAGQTPCSSANARPARRPPTTRWATGCSAGCSQRRSGCRRGSWCSRWRRRRALTARLDLGKLQNPREVAKLAERYVVAAAGSGAAGAASPLLGLLPAGGLLA